MLVRARHRGLSMWHARTALKERLKALPTDSVQRIPGFRHCEHDRTFPWRHAVGHVRQMPRQSESGGTADPYLPSDDMVSGGRHSGLNRHTTVWGGLPVLWEQQGRLQWG